jgi:hypothetical protein
MSNNFDTPVLLDDVNNYFGFGRNLPFGDESTGPRLLVRDLDPSAGAGIVAPLGSFLLRNTTGTVQCWQKTGALDTNWTLISGGGSVGAGYVFVLDPAGVAAGNVYIDWPTLYAAASATAGAKLVQVRSAATIPAGVYDVEGWILEGSQDSTPTLTIADSATFTDERFFAEWRFLQVNWTATASVAYASTRSFMFTLRRVSLNLLGTASHITQDQDVVMTLVMTDGSTVGLVGTGPLAETLDATATIRHFIDGASSVDNDVFTGLGDWQVFPQGQASLSSQLTATVDFQWPDRELLQDNTEAVAINQTPALLTSLMLVNCAAGNVTITLDPINGTGWEGRRITIQKSDGSANQLIVNCDAGDTINGGASVFTASPYGRVDLVNDNSTAWFAAIT